MHVGVVGAGRDYCVASAAAVVAGAEGSVLLTTGVVEGVLLGEVLAVAVSSGVAPVVVCGRLVGVACGAGGWDCGVTAVLACSTPLREGVGASVTVSVGWITV